MPIALITVCRCFPHQSLSSCLQKNRKQAASLTCGKRLLVCFNPPLPPFQGGATPCQAHVHRFNNKLHCLPKNDSSQQKAAIFRFIFGSHADNKFCEFGICFAQIACPGLLVKRHKKTGAAYVSKTGRLFVFPPTPKGAKSQSAAFR